MGIPVEPKSIVTALVIVWAIAMIIATSFIFKKRIYE
jgi:hypothetical protein